MRNALLVLIGAFLLYAGSVASAFWDTGFQVEIYTGGTYVYASTPYTYAYNDYYYVDYPFRINTYSDYYYFQPGWYSFDPYWEIAPSYGSYYSYYPSDYYYYNNTWTNSPNWATTYGPQYYGSYYFPPATLTGQHIQPQKVASCNEATLTVDSFSVNAAGKNKATFYINNFSDRDLKIENASIYIEGTEVSTSNPKFDKTIAPNSYGTIEFDAFGEKGAYSASYKGSVKVSATFADGTYCSSEDLQATFYTTVNGASTVKSKTNSDIYTYNTAQGSTSQIVPKQGWNEAELIRANSYKYNTGNFSDYESGRGNYDGKNRNRDNYTVVNANERKQIVEDSCEDLSVGKENISTWAGESSTKYFALRNFGSEDFSIDKIEAIEYSDGFSIEASRDSPKVFAGEYGAIKVKVFGENKVDAATAYIKVTGHYNSGLTCTKLSENFYVSVNKEAQLSAQRIGLEFVGSTTLSNGSGFVKFSFENDSDMQTTLMAYTDRGTVSPAVFTFAPRTLGERVVAINGAKSGTNLRLVLESEDGKSITKSAFFASENTPVTDTNAAAQPPVNNGPGFNLLGFSILGNGALLLGLIIIVLLVAFMFWRQQQ